MRARDNPFRSERLDRLAFRYPPGLDRPSLLRRLAELGHRAAIVGPEGSGKTTLSRDLEQALGGDYRIWRVTRHRGERRLARALPRLGSADYVILDGADQLGWAEFQRLRRRARRAGGLLVLSHRPGLLPTLIVTTTSQALLDTLAAELAPGDIGEPSALEQHRGNIREALRARYDRCAEAAG
jgi:hypothetical protein